MNNLIVGGVTMRRLLSAETASVAVYSNVVSKQNASYLMNRALQTIERSTVVSDEEETDTRTSFGTFLDHGELAQVKQMREMFERFCAIAGRPYDPSTMEDLQILRYEPGQEYFPHYDFFDPQTKQGRESIEAVGQRVATLVVYLNDVAEGGETIFPNIGGLSVAPHIGNATYFDYPNQELDSLHGGNPVIKGVKWVATQWWNI